MAVTTALIEGRRKVAHDLINEPDGKVIAMLGDSLTSQLGYADLKFVRSTLGIRAVHGDTSGDPWSFPLDIAGVADSDPAAPSANGWVDNTQIANLIRVNILGGTAGSISNHLSNRLYAGILRCRENSQGSSAKSTPTEVTDLIGVDWLGEALAAGDLDVEFYIYQHPGGPQGQHYFLDVLSDATIVGTSEVFSGYAAAGQWRKVTVTIPQSTVLGATDNVGVHIRIVGGANTTDDTGTTLVMSSRHTYRSVLPGVCIINYARGTLKISDYLNAPDALYELLEEIGVTHWIHSLGQNGDAGRNNANDFEADTKTLIAKAPTTVKHLLVPTHATSSYAPAGGDVDEAYMVTGYSQVIDDQPQHLLLNRHRFLPSFQAIEVYLSDGIHQKDDSAPMLITAQWGLIREAASEYNTLSTIVDQNVNDRIVYAETILYVKIGATTQHLAKLGVFGSVVTGTPSAQLYIDNTATGTAYNLTVDSGANYLLPITLANDATLKGKSVRVVVMATVDDRVCEYFVSSSAAVTATTIQATGVPVLPAVGIVESRSSGVTLKPAVGETISQSITVYEADGSTPVYLSGKTLAVVFETRNRVDVAVVPNGDITVNGDDSNIVTFAYPAAVTASERVLRFSLKDASAPGTVYLDGLCVVAYAAGVDDA